MSDNVLQRILADKRQQNIELAAHYPLQDYQHTLRPSDRSLYSALTKPEAGFILECKKASPSKGLIRPDFDPVTLARAYQPYAAAISVLTEPDYFQGSLDYLAAVRGAVHQPILCKDFFINTEQVYRARYFGADAILLMLSVLDDNQYRELAAVANTLQLDVLTEVANEEEMRRAANFGANIIGINHRDLTNLTINPNRSAELAPLAPPSSLLIAESGFNSHQDIRRVAPHVNGFLVGSALSARTDVDAACRSLIFGENKVCGLTRPEDALNAAAAGARFGGLIFAERSPRRVTIEGARTVMAATHPLRYVGVFSDHPLADLVQTALSLQLHAVQLHGNEDIDYISQLKNKLKRAGADDIQIWQALRIESPADLNHLPSEERIDRLLLDNGAGGTGETFDWSALSALEPQHRQRCLLAGGISPMNVTTAIGHGVAGVDSSSQLEVKPGIKDAVKIHRLFEQIRRYGRFSQQSHASHYQFSRTQEAV